MPENQTKPNQSAFFSTNLFCVGGCFFFFFFFLLSNSKMLALSAGAVEYADCTSAGV